MCAAPVFPEWTDRSVAFSTAWLQAFGLHVAKQDGEALSKLFHPDVIIFGGSRKSPLEVDNPKGFHIALKEAKIRPMDPLHSLVMVDWKVRSSIIGGSAKKGQATFIIYITEAEGESPGTAYCIHAHFSSRQ